MILKISQNRFRLASWVLAILIALGLIIKTSPDAGEIKVHLSGDIEFPGFMSLNTGSFGIKQLCFLGITAKGNMDSKFLKALSEKGIPEGSYSLGGPLSQEQWPSPTFTKSGALRFRPVFPPAPS